MMPTWTQFLNEGALTNYRNEKEGRKLLEKNKSYNKLMDNNMPFSDKTYNRKTGVRKFYKQKNLLENH